MNKHANRASLALALSAALGVTTTMAQTAPPAATQLPGKGTVVAGSATAGAVSGGAQTITVGNGTVIDWGSGTDLNSAGVGGFNIGSDASLTFAGGNGVLNIDSSGNPSQIFGNLTSTGPNVFVANRNGIVVGAGATVSSPAAIGLIGNALNSTGGFDGTAGSVDYNATTGGDVTVQQGASISGATVMVTGGDVVSISGAVNFQNTAQISGSQVNMLANITGATGSSLTVSAGAARDDYAVRVGSGKTVSADTVTIMGMDNGSQRGTKPNMIIQGTVRGQTINLGGAVGDFSHSMSDVFSGPSGKLVASNVRIAFTGKVKNAPYLNTSFRYNYLPITQLTSGGVSLELEPVNYTTNGTSNGKAAANILVTGDARLVSPTYIANVGNYGTTTATTGALVLPNTHLVLQSTGDISTQGSFYWPGYVYLGNIGTNSNGSAAPGTLGAGTITLAGGYFSNVLPGSVDAGGGLHFVTRNPLSLANGLEVRTNANSWINLGTDALTTGYRNGTYGGIFIAGVRGDGVVNYGPMDPSRFHTQRQ